MFPWLGFQWEIFRTRDCMIEKYGTNCSGAFLLRDVPGTHSPLVVCNCALKK